MGTQLQIFIHIQIVMSTRSHPSSTRTDLAAGEPSSICADTAPPCENHAGTCRPTERGVWPAEHPVSPGTQLRPAPVVRKWLRQPHTAPSPGTMPHNADQQSTPDELQHSQCGWRGRGKLVMRMTRHLRDTKDGERHKLRRNHRKSKCQKLNIFEKLTLSTLIVVNIAKWFQSSKLHAIKKCPLSRQHV